MIKQIKNNIYCFKGIGLCSNVYIIKDKKIIIDTGSKDNKESLIKELKLIDIDPLKIKKVILTHLHHDHIGNVDVFKNAEILASEEEINSLKNNSFNTILRENLIKNLKNVKVLKDFDEFKIIKTQGHTIGSICILYKDILFSGDTLFNNGFIGRTDLPNSVPEEMDNSLKKLEKINYKILCPGH